MKKIALIFPIVLFHLSTHAQLRLNSNNELFLNHSYNNQIGSANFTLTDPDGGFGGMYINGTDTQAKPFYGYATDNIAQAWTYYDRVAAEWRLSLNGLDRIRVNINSTILSNNLSVEESIFASDQFILGDPPNPKVIMNDEGLLLGRSTQFNSLTGFTMSRDINDFYGMYVDVRKPEQGGLNRQKPFYGYSVDNIGKAFTYYDEATTNWKLAVDGNDEDITASDMLEVDEKNLKLNGGLLINTYTPYNQYTDVMVKSNSTTYGGMYIEVKGAGQEKPFYGYVVNDSARAFSYYDNNSSTWKLNISPAGNVGSDILEAEESRVLVNGSIRLKNGEPDTTSAAGEIYYHDGGFYGYTGNDEIRRLDNVASFTPINNPEVLKLKEENQILKEQLETMQAQLEKFSNRLESLENSKKE